MDWLSREERLSSAESCLNCSVISQWLKLQDRTQGTNRCRPELDLLALGSEVTRRCACRLNESRHWPFLLLPCFGTLALWQARSFFGGGQRGTSCNGKTATCQSELAVPLWWVKKKRITLGVEKLRRVWDGSCISGQKKKKISGWWRREQAAVVSAPTEKVSWFHAFLQIRCWMDQTCINVPLVIICRGCCSLLSQHLSANLFGIVHTHARPNAYPVENRFTWQQWVSLSHRLAGHTQWGSSLRMFFFF